MDTYAVTAPAAMYEHNVTTAGRELSRAWRAIVAQARCVLVAEVSDTNAKVRGWRTHRWIAGHVH